MGLYFLNRWHQWQLRKNKTIYIKVLINYFGDEHLKTHLNNCTTKPELKTLGMPLYLNRSTVGFFFFPGKMLVSVVFVAEETLLL